MAKRVRTVILLSLIVGLAPRSLDAQITPTYVQFDPYTVKGALYRPRKERARNVGVLLIHRVNNYLGHICLLYTSPSPRDRQKSRMPSSA